VTAVSDLDGSAGPKTEDVPSAHQIICMQTITRENRLLEAPYLRASESLCRQRAKHHFSAEMALPDFDKDQPKSIDCRRTFSSNPLILAISLLFFILHTNY
jgi:hypothetical protein